MNRILIITFCIAGTLCQAQTQPTNTQELIEKMHSTYKDVWYKTLTFTQQTEFFKEGVKEREEIWYEATDLNTGALVIKFNSMDSGDGLIFRNDSIFAYTKGVQTLKRPKVHELIVLGFTVYSDAPEKTLEKIRRAGFNTDHFSRDSYLGKVHYVVGDPAVSQFWIDAETLLFTKMTRKLKDGRISEIEFKGYQKQDKGWIETEVTFTTDGKLTMREVYSNIQSPSKLPASFFNQVDFAKISW